MLLLCCVEILGMDTEMLKICFELVMQDGLQLQYIDDEIKNKVSTNKIS